jgi:hypothetical protein
MTAHQGGQPFRRAAIAGDDDFGIAHDLFDAALADLFERRLLRREIVIEAGLAHAEPVGDVLGRGAVKAHLGEHRGRRSQHFLRSAPWSRARPPWRQIGVGDACPRLGIVAHGRLNPNGVTISRAIHPTATRRMEFARQQDCDRVTFNPHRL